MSSYETFLRELSEVLNVNIRLLEKDFLMHNILTKLTEIVFWREFLFKGGTCLIKCYLGYYRFSVDLDFTYVGGEKFLELPQKKVRRELSKKIDDTCNKFSQISKVLGLDLACDKSNRQYIEIGGNNRFLTLKLWHKNIMGLRDFIKIQINFAEKTLFDAKEVMATSICTEDPRLAAYGTYYQDYRRQITVRAYHPYEILCEKIRSILTRRGIKYQDFVDVYMIAEKYRIKPWNLREHIIEKTRLMLKLYQKYRKNIAIKTKLLADIRPKTIVKLARETLLVDIDTDKFETYVAYLKKFLLDLIHELMSTR